MATYFTEADYERSVIELFQNLGYSHIYAPELERGLMPLLQRLCQCSAILSRAVLCSATKFL